MLVNLKSVTYTAPIWVPLIQYLIHPVFFFFSIHSFNFQGTVDAVGGSGTDAPVNQIKGGTGTIYIHDNIRGYVKTTLLVDGRLNSDLPTQHFTVIAEEQDDSYLFDTVVLKGKLLLH